MGLVERLEAIGFRNFYTYRIGICFQCEKTVLTFFNPELKRWYCEDCWYDTDFISELELIASENTMSNMTVEQRLAAMEQRYSQLEAENAKLKASREDNCFLGGTGNVTLKSRAINPKAWGVPTKAESGQAYFRCSDFPFSFDIFSDQKGQSFIRAFTAIPVDSRQAQVFQENFLNQRIVVAKRRQSKEEQEATSATATAFGPQPAGSAPPATASPAPSTGPRSFSTLPEPERIAFSVEADKLMAVPGLFKDKVAALKSLLDPKGIAFP